MYKRQGYKIDNKFAPYLTLTPGNTYIFDQSDSSNLNHPLLFYLDSNKANSYAENVKSIGTPGADGAYTEIQITSTSPETLYYQCGNHGLMGDSVRTNLGSTTADNNGIFSITSTRLIEGNYSLTATATDDAGNVSPPSSISLQYVIHAITRVTASISALFLSQCICLNPPPLGYHCKLKSLCRSQWIVLSWPVVYIFSRNLC